MLVNATADTLWPTRICVFIWIHWKVCCHMKAQKLSVIGVLSNVTRFGPQLSADRHRSALDPPTAPNLCSFGYGISTSFYFRLTQNKILAASRISPPMLYQKLRWDGLQSSIIINVLQEPNRLNLLSWCLRKPLSLSRESHTQWLFYIFEVLITFFLLLGCLGNLSSPWINAVRIQTDSSPYLAEYRWF